MQSNNNTSIYIISLVLALVFFIIVYSYKKLKTQYNTLGNKNINSLENKNISTLTFLSKVFPSYFWIGLTLILLSIILDKYIESEKYSFLITIFINLTQSIGVSILVATIFSFAATTADFTQRIKGFLEDIIIKRNFLSNIEPEGKKEALRALIKPSDKELSNLPNINDYYDHFINNTLAVQSKNVRSNYSIQVKIYIDPDDEKVKAEGIYTYRLYPSANGYNPIIIGFDEEKETGSKCIHIKVYNQKGALFTKEIDNLQEIKEDGNTHRRQEGKIDLTNEEIAKDQKYLDIELKVIEVGNIDSLLLQFKALQPTNGFKFNLECSENLQIRNHAVFVVNAKHYETLSEDKKSITISCNQWINEGSGVCVSILKDNNN
ncbi:hypothetical protein [Haemophilus sp. Marseille-Q0026]|uniref:hypothetical protein n=1 Tax=Haemophilus sp. Marseille-Q0026 TaxID=2866580 RepID=UPI001CF8EE13|nr:hypothetical protein [Haemophilus sp. Marseille-Q0026]